MNKKLIFAHRELRDDPIVDARNPFIWIDCGSIVVPFDATDAQVEQAKQEAGIPDEALCVCAQLV